MFYPLSLSINLNRHDAYNAHNAHNAYSAHNTVDALIDDRDAEAGQALMRSSIAKGAYIEMIKNIGLLIELIRKEQARHAFFQRKLTDCYSCFSFELNKKSNYGFHFNEIEKFVMTAVKSVGTHPPHQLIRQGNLDAKLIEFLEANFKNSPLFIEKIKAIKENRAKSATLSIDVASIIINDAAFVRKREREKIEKKEKLEKTEKILPLRKITFPSAFSSDNLAHLPQKVLQKSRKGKKDKDMGLNQKIKDRASSVFSSKLDCTLLSCSSNFSQDLIFSENLASFVNEHPGPEPSAAAFAYLEKLIDQCGSSQEDLNYLEKAAKGIFPPNS